MNFQTVAFTRDTFLKLLNTLSVAQLGFIPKGFNNHILWNIGHILVVEQLLTYGLSGLDLPIDTKFIEMYSKGSTPSKNVSKKDVEEIIANLITVSKQTEKDYKKGIFKTFKAYPTSTGIVLKNIEDALQFNTFHEGLHLGIILAIKKLL